MLLPAALLAWGCTEPLAPHASPPGALLPAGSASFSREDEEGLGARDGRLDIHAVNVSIETMLVNSVVIDLYSFHVKGRPGEMKGRFKLYQLRSIEGQMEAEVIASGEMICGTVVGNRARVAGRITHTTFPEGLPVNLELIWGVTDNGRGENAPDTGSQPLGLPPLGGEAYCLGGGFPPEQPVGKGQVKIRS